MLTMVRAGKSQLIGSTWTSAMQTEIFVFSQKGDKEEAGGSKEKRDREENANGLFNEIDELKCILSLYKHFSSDVLDVEIYIEGFIMLEL